MLVDDLNTNRFYFFEILKEEEAAEAHWETDVFKTWSGIVKKCLTERSGVVTRCEQFFRVTVNW